MREILFRGKRIDNGQWVEGSLILFKCEQCGIAKDNINDNTHLYPSDENDFTYWDIEHLYVPKVIPETVGQYTGITVPSGKIFEHDIVTAKFKSNGARYNFTVKYSDKSGCYVFDNRSIKVPFNAIRSVRIIGNIHDNPELLGNK